MSATRLEDDPFYLDANCIQSNLTMINQGMYAHVCKVKISIIGREMEVAAKLFVDTGSHGVTAARLFQNEKNTIEALARLDAPHVVKYYGHTDVFDAQQSRYFPALMLELAPLGSLVAHLPELGANPAMSTRVMLQAAAGFQFMHMHHILHGDPKPENLLVFPNWEVKWCDFGLSATLPLHRPRVTGTISRMAPEVIKHGHLSDASDIYSLGLMFLEMWDGVLYEPSTREKDTLLAFIDVERRPDIPLEPRDKKLQMIEWMLENNPVDRPTASNVIDVLENPSEELIAENQFRRLRIKRRVSNALISMADNILIFHEMLRLHVEKIKNTRLNCPFNIVPPPRLDLRITPTDSLEDQTDTFIDILLTCFADKNTMDGYFPSLFWLMLHSPSLSDLYTENDCRHLQDLIDYLRATCGAFEKMSALNDFIKLKKNYLTLRYSLTPSFLDFLYHATASGFALCKAVTFITDINKYFPFRDALQNRVIAAELGKLMIHEPAFVLMDNDDVATRLTFAIHCARGPGRFGVFERHEQVDAMEGLQEGVSLTWN
jgi:serine/threonine protein kinase